MHIARHVALSLSLLALPTAASAEPRFEEALAASIALDEVEELGDGADAACATSAIRRVQNAWESLDNDLRARADRLLPGAVHGEGGDATSLARGTVQCDLTLANVVESDHFSVQWGPGVTMTEDIARYLLDNMEEVRAFFLAEGYPEPAGNPDLKVPFYFGNSGGGAPAITFDGGYTTMCNTGEHAYVVMSSMRADDGNVELATHELFHAIQMGGPNANEVDGFYWEASAVWSEDFAHPDWNTYAWVLGAYTGETDLPLRDESVFQHRYALFVYVSYLAEWAPGGLDLVRHVWTTSDRGDLAARLESYWEAQRGTPDFVATDFPEQFAHFTARTAVMDYADHDLYMGAPVEAKGEIAPPEDLSDVDSPGYYGSHYYKIDPSGAEGRSKLRVTFQGAEDRQWLVAFSRSPDGRSSVSSQMYLDRSGFESVDLLDIGTTYDETWVIVTRIDESASTYTLTTEFLEQTEPPGSDLLPGQGGGGNGFGGAGGGCGGGTYHPFSFPSATPMASLASMASPPALFLLAALLGTLRRRRRF